MKRFWIASLPFIAAGTALAAAVWPGQAKPAAIPGITAKDAFPNGCVSCHIVTPKDGDKRLNAVVKGIPKHPALGMVKIVPNDCMKCHKAAVKAIPFGASAHKSHYGKAEKSQFVQMFHGSCTHCHDFNATSGLMTLKSGAKNW
jgi:hypothetical protein